MDARQTPTFSVNVPTAPDGDGESAAQLASAYFGEPLEWQRRALDVLLCRDEHDRYGVPTFAMSVPRQNGKSWIVRARCFYGLVCCGEQILFTCQHGDTSGEMFRDLAAPFEDEDNEELHPLLKAVRKTNGQQAIYLTNGGMVRFTTRTDSLARGRTYDVLIYDEAQELTSAQQAASMPTISASKTKNTQTIYLGTPPGPTCAGDVFARMHDMAHVGQFSGVWMEWAADRVGDPEDTSRWYECNPSMGALLNESAVMGEAASMLPDYFARERLGWWCPITVISSAIPHDLWARSTVDGISDRYDGTRALAVKFSPDGARYALAGCKLDADKNAAFELIEVGDLRNGTRALARALIERADKTSCVMVDGQSGAPALVNRLEDMGAPRNYVRLASSLDVVKAAGMVLDGLRDETLVHTGPGQQLLDDSATSSVRRDIGRNGGWGFGSAEGHDSTPIEAASLALYGAMTTRRNPRKKQRLL